MAEPIDSLRDQAVAHHAHSILLLALIEKIKDQDLRFPDHVRHKLHEALGRQLAQTGEPTQMNARLREVVEFFVSDSGSYSFPMPTTPRTLRRRFLNWLERG
jgi:hypothetical protein